MLEAIKIEDLKPGMFVNEVIEQKGKLKIKTKGLVKSVKSIDMLKNKGVTKVEIDLSRSNLPPPVVAPEAEQNNVKETPPPADTKIKNYSDSEQLEAATKLYDEALIIQSRFFKRLAANDTPSLSDVKDLSANIIESVINMPSGLSCLTLLNKSGKYLLEHSLNCSILLTMFAKYRDMGQQAIEELSLAGLLMDVGMTNMPKDITQSPGRLTLQQKEIITTHVDIGLDLVDRCGDVTAPVQDIIFNHHERIDGTGYPDAQSEHDVSEYVRMAGIVDSYDAMINDRPFRKAVTPSKALVKLLSDESYDQALVAQFIKCLGVHPVGSLVKLDNDRLAIIMRGNKETPMKPVVAAFYNIKTSSYSEVKKLDLSQVNVKIVSAVRPEEFGLNLTKFLKEILITAL
ncbi:MAG: HD domain-containing phosphohydrolase [Aliiglaciecola sp.]|uniref:HD-GYP domain-containing protein n=1 Tax=Aliiglaciecola sp. TaxID=1872441 RepID=UPI0032983851